MLASQSILLRIGLALLLLFAQQQAVQHAFEHDFERLHASSKASSGPDDAFCAKCLAVAHLDHGDGVAQVQLALASFSFPPHEVVLRDSASLAFVAGYHSRAPPDFS